LSSDAVSIAQNLRQKGKNKAAEIPLPMKEELPSSSEAVEKQLLESGIFTYNCQREFNFFRI
jgi:hypothetical protein